jgi:hypothetical protein
MLQIPLGGGRGEKSGGTSLAEASFRWVVAEFRGDMGPTMLEKAGNHVSEKEMDMHRRNAQLQGGLMRRWLGALLGFQHGGLPIGTPRRSIDREQQEYSPYTY